MRSAVNVANIYISHSLHLEYIRRVSECGWRVGADERWIEYPFHANTSIQLAKF